MKTIIVSIQLSFLITYFSSFAQSDNDTLSNSSKYIFNFSLDPQEGYSLVVGLRCGLPKSDLYNCELSIAKTVIKKGGETSVGDLSIGFELSSFKSDYFYALSTTWNFRSALDLGISLNYMSNFSGSGALQLRPHIGIMIPPYGTTYAECGYNVSIAKKNFQTYDYWFLGIRLTIGFLKKI